MYISEISLENFRGFKTATKINFTEGINVIIGQNNAGKTTVIKALELLFDSEKGKRLNTDDFNRNISIEEIKEKPPKIAISAILEESDNDEEYSDDLVMVSTWLTKIDKPYKAQITYEFSLPDKESENYIKIMDSIESQDINDYWNEIEYNFIRKYTNKVFIGNPSYKNSIEPETLKKFDFQFLTAIRDVERDLFTGKNSLLREVIDFFIDYEIKTDSQLKNDEKVQEIMKRKKEFSKDASNLIESLQKRMKSGKVEMLKYASETGASFDNFKPSFDGKILDTELYSALKLIVESETGIKLPASQNGLGYNNLIYISLLLAKMQKNASGEYLGSNSKVFSILSIEEPEAHLHPNMQYKFIKFLNENKKNKVRQIFITSHSPNITASVDIDDIIVLCKENEEITIAYPGRTFSDDKDDIESKNYVKRFIDVTKADMFFARRLIFVEGLAEQLLIPEFARMLNCDLVDEHISIINVGGRYFKHFLKLFDIKNSNYAINKKVVCITDLDPMRKEKIDDSSWKSCLPLLLDNEKDKYEYTTCSNKIVDEYTSRNNDDMIRVYSQDKTKSCTFEYDLILCNPTLQYLITKSVSNDKEIGDMMVAFEKKESLENIVNIIRKGKYKDNIINAIGASNLDYDEKTKHIIAGRYLKSIKKGEVAQELTSVISKEIENENSKLVIPKYIREAIEWICQK